MRRKGEKKLDGRFRWFDGCCIEHAIRTGSNWLEAWTVQQTVPEQVLMRATGMSVSRIVELRYGNDATPEELEALANVLRTDVASLEASIAYERKIGEMPF